MVPSCDLWELLEPTVWSIKGLSRKYCVSMIVILDVIAEAPLSRAQSWAAGITRLHSWRVCVIFHITVSTVVMANLWRHELVVGHRSNFKAILLNSKQLFGLVQACITLHYFWMFVMLWLSFPSSNVSDLILLVGWQEVCPSNEMSCRISSHKFSFGDWPKKNGLDTRYERMFVPLSFTKDFLLFLIVRVVFL